jgi:hypothetical protein
VTLAEGRAQQILAEQHAVAQSLLQTVSAEISAYSKIRDELGLQVCLTECRAQPRSRFPLRAQNDALIEYVWWDSLEQQSQSQFFVGMQPAQVIAARP